MNWPTVFSRKLPSPYRERSNQGEFWFSRYSQISRAEIGCFLAILSDAFLFPEKLALLFHPQDVVKEIYRALYPAAESVDGLEMEFLAVLLASKYGVILEGNWMDTTLGELLQTCCKTML